MSNYKSSDEVICPMCAPTVNAQAERIRTLKAELECEHNDHTETQNCVIEWLAQRDAQINALRDEANKRASTYADEAETVRFEREQAKLRVATLEGELRTQQKQADQTHTNTQAIATALRASNNALRDALEKIRGCMGWDYGKGWDAPEDVLEIAITALEATPAASLAALKAEVIAEYEKSLEPKRVGVRALAAQEVKP